MSSKKREINSHDKLWNPYDENFKDPYAIDTQKTGKLSDLRGNSDGYNTKTILFMGEVAKIAIDANKDDVNSLRKCFYRYVTLCAENDYKMGNMTAYVAMGVSSNDISDWARGLGRGKDSDYKELALEVKRWCAAYREQIAMDGKVNPVLAIFWQKNFDGLRDEQQVMVQADNPYGDNPTAEKIAEKYKELPED